MPSTTPGSKKRRRRGGRREHPSIFHDLGIDLRPTTSVEAVQDTTRRLGQLGYACVAYNETVVGRDGIRGLERPANKKARDTLWLAAQGGTEGPATRLRRVTIIVDDPGETQFLCGAIRSLKWADLVAARPTSDKALTLLCESGDVDIISLDLSARLGFSLNAKQADKALARGLVFEVRYAQAITEENAQKKQQLLANISGLMAATRGRGLVWSSGSGAAAECLRGPHDVLNLAVVLGLKEEQALASLTSNGISVRGHAEARRLEWLPVEIVQGSVKKGGGEGMEVDDQGQDD